MPVEQAAYGSRWRAVHPGAKALITLCALLAALTAPGSSHALVLAGAMTLLTLFGAGTPARLYLRVAAPAWGLLAFSSLGLLVSIAADAGGWQLQTREPASVLPLIARSLAALSASLFLILSTPLPELIALLRRLRCPDVLLDTMVLAYRSSSVLHAALHDARCAQQLRLGRAGFAQRLHASALLAAGLAGQLWQRAHWQQQAASARLGEGPLCFLPRDYPQARRELAIATLAGSLLLGLNGIC